MAAAPAPGVSDGDPVTTSNGTGRHADLAGARPVILLRHRPGHAGSTVHLAPLPADGRPGALTALCGNLLRPDDVEQVTPGEGAPCPLCMVSHVGTLAPDTLPPDTLPPDMLPPDTLPDSNGPSADPDAGPAAAAATYREWGWPVLLRGEQVWLAVGTEATALLIPTALATRAATILTERRCPPAMLTHPYSPEHQVLLAGEPYGVPLPWPAGVHRVATSVLLPPTTTPRGPLTWSRAPLPNTLTLCREIDVLAAVRTALAEPPPSGPADF